MCKLINCDAASQKRAFCSRKTLKSQNQQKAKKENNYNFCPATYMVVKSCKLDIINDMSFYSLNFARK